MSHYDSFLAIYKTADGETHGEYLCWPARLGMTLERVERYVRRALSAEPLCVNTAYPLELEAVSETGKGT